MTGKSDQGRLDEMTPEQRRALLGRMLERRRGGPRERPVSFAQRRLWFVDQLDRGGSFSNTASALRLRGVLDGDVLGRALDEIVARHEALRTTLGLRDGEPVQLVASPAPVAVERVDLSARPPTEREQALRGTCEELARRPFDLSSGPLLRVRLVALGPREHVLLLVVHHIVFDGWSNDVFVSELRALYAAFAAGDPSPLPPLPIQYGDYAAWQAERLTGDVLEGLLAHERERLAGAPAFELPGDHPRPALQRHEARKTGVVLPEPVAAGLERLARAHGATLFMTVLAALEVLLARVSGQADVVLGTPVAGRVRAETEGLIGCFINTVVLRDDLSGDPTFSELLVRVRGTCLDAFDHAELPFERLVEELQPERDLSRNPIVQVLFMLQEGLGPAAAAEPADGLTVEPVELDSQTTRLDLEVYAFRAQDGLRLVFNASAALFEADTIERLLGCFATLLGALVEDAQRPISTLPLLDAAQRAAALGRLVGPCPEPPEAPSVHGLVLAQAARTPAAPAARCGDQVIRYGELVARASRLGRQLSARGHGPGDLVGLHLERGLPMLVGVLGVLVSGAAYVPLDPGFPAQRLRFMVADAELVTVLRDVGEPSVVADLVPAELVLDAAGEVVDAPPRSATDVAADDAAGSPGEVGTDDLAYVIYTSGSTGRPKGVRIGHGAAVNLLTAMVREPGLGADDVLVAVTTLSFDIALPELLAPLVAGGQVVIASRDQAADGERLGALLSEVGATVLQATPASWRLLLAAGWPVGVRPRALVGGEAWDHGLARQLLARCESVWNMYGPTESTVWSAVRRVREDDTDVAVGAPIAHTSLYVLDERLGPQPVGVAGELYIGGAGLAQGYHRRPELTAERFVPDPFDDAPGARLYRTGDSVRLRRDGTLQFLGRLDGQIKLRGHRIELGEIEAALTAHPDVPEAAVLLDEAAGEPRLVAYAAPGPSPDALRAHLRARLPEYMLPTVFVAVDAWPRTPNGKLDRKALPAPRASDVARAAEHVPPRDEAEALLADVWADVLGVDTPGVHDDFFELGGHSLLATRMVGRVREVFDVELPLAEVFGARRLGELAARILALRGRATTLPALGPRSEDAPLAVSLQQQRLWFLDRLEPGASAYVMPMARRLRGALDVEALRCALQAVVDRHEVLRSRLVDEGGAPVLHVDAPAPFSLPVDDLSGLPDAEREEAWKTRVREAARRPFDLAAGPLVRARLLALAPDDHVLLVDLHHVVGDALSLELLARELGEAYAATAEARPPALAPLTLQYADYAAWQRACFEGGAMDAQLDWWRATLSDLPPPLDLPVDHPRSQTGDPLGVRETLAVPAATVAALRRLGREQGASLFMVLLAAFDTLLMRLTGQPDIVVGAPVSGRSHVDLEPLVGFFINTLVLRNDLSGSPTFRELLERVRRSTLDALEHQDVPFERLVEELPVRRDLGRNPVFGVFVNMLDVSEDEGLRLGDLEVSHVGGQEEHAKFDLTLYLFARDDELSVGLVASRELFEVATIRALLQRFGSLLESVAADPGRPLEALRLLSADERRLQATRQAPELLAHGFVPFEAEEVEQSVGRRFVAQVRRDPERAAIRAPAATWSYAELDARTRAVAGALRTVASADPDAHGFAPRVVLLMDDTAQMSAAALGALRAGLAYVPLDPAHPEAWLAAVCADTEPVALLAGTAQLELARRLSHANGASEVAVIDAEALDMEAAPAASEVDADPSPDALAYVRYTSGSTGRPKGVMQSHRGLLAQIRAYTNSLHLSADDRFSALGSFTHDGGLMDVYSALLNGACLCPLSLRALGPDAIVEALDDLGVSVYHSTPTAFRHLFAERSDGRVLPAARLVVFGGEELRASELPLFVRHFGPDARLVNGLGATESSQALQAFLHPDALGDRPRVPVGHPVEGTEVLLLDAQGEETDVLGEIAVRSEHVALGYWRRPEETQAAFSPGPAGRGHVRTWRSGDLGRRLADGSLEWLGRLDDQLKLRGLRVEPHGVATVLEGLDDVARAAVVPRAAPSGDMRLVGYVVPADGRSPSAPELARVLREQLPEASVPAAFVLLAGLPLTAGGKLDRHGLPEPAWDATAAPTGARVPQTPTEERLARIVAEVLDVEAVDVEADFFELGGHSLLATRVVSRVAAAFGVELPLAEMFDRPSVARLAGRLDELVAAPSPVPLQAPVAGSGEPVLAFGQQRFWFLEQLQPAAGTYALHVARRLRGAVDVDALERAASAVVARHELLRTSFPEGPDGVPCCALAEPAPLPVAYTDLSGLAPADAAEQVAALGAREARHGFDVTRGPLLRLHLVRVSDDEHVLFVTLHHIICDAWSLDVFWRELGVHYAAERAGRPAALPELPVQYADFAHWQHARLSEARAESLLAYWTEHLAGAPPLLDLPTDRPRPAVESMEGARVSRMFDSELTGRLNACASEHEVTLFMVLLAGLQELLRRNSGQDDIVVGTPVAGRLRAEFEGLIGLFVNSLPLRTDLSGDPTFRELLERVRATAIGGYDHQELPFERLVRALRPARAMSHHPLFQVMLVLQNAPRTRVELSGLEERGEATSRTTSAFDLSLHAWEVEGSLVLTAEYKPALFDEDTVGRLLEQLERLLGAASAEPGKPIGEHVLIDERERQQLLAEGHDTTRPVPTISMHGLVLEQARRRPDAPAVEFEGQQLTYGELDVASAAFARRLRALGVGPGSRVALCMERGPRMVEVLLGVLRAGAAYVPLDPEHPAERLRFALTDAQVDALVVAPDVPAGLAVDAFPVVRLDDSGGELWPDGSGAAPGTDAPPGAEVLDEATPDDLAYVIYTSGSTGRPKGVEICHGAVVNFLLSMHETPGLTEDDVLLSVTTLSFDIAVLEIFGPLTVGARLVLVPADVAADGLRLEARLSRSRATICQATPATWRMLVEARWPGDRRLALLCGGEAWSRQLADELLPRCGSLWNMYGPTETTIWSAVQRVEPGDAPVVIGAPVANTRLHVLDERGRLQPLGVPGELCIGGAGLARGYWRRPELTAERFIPDPFDDAEGARLYRTGDRVRRRKDGTLEFLGRIDHQVKVQGFRIELGEIESLLRVQPGVVEAVAAAHEHGPGDTRLVAYVLREPDTQPDVAALSEALARQLPGYMVPRQFMLLDELPRTPNGKLDRGSLPAPSARVRADDAAVQAPETDIEKRLAAIWCELLELDEVSLHDNFFDLGGHSLLALRVVVRLEDATGVRINPGELILQSLGQVAGVCERVLSPGAATADPADPAEGTVDRSSDVAKPTGWAGRLWRRARGREKRR